MMRLDLRNFLFAVAAAAVLPLAGGYETKLDIPYYEADSPRTGDSAYIDGRCKLDLRYPTHLKGFPAVVYFHGGGLTGGGKKLGPVPNQDIAVAAVNYRLSSDKAKCPDYIYDAAAAVAWVLKHIAEYGGDPKRVFVAGSSAGGWLAAMIALDPRYLEKFGRSPSELAGVMALSGQMTTHFQVLKEYREQGRKVPKVVVDEYAPVSYVRKDAPPLVFAVGDNVGEIPGRVGENIMIHSLLVAAGHRDCRVFQYPGFRHGTMWRPGLQHLWLWVNGMERRVVRKPAAAKAESAEPKKSKDR